jgi:hypothetical protein
VLQQFLDGLGTTVTGAGKELFQLRQRGRTAAWRAFALQGGLTPCDWSKGEEQRQGRIIPTRTLLLFSSIHAKGVERETQGQKRGKPSSSCTAIQPLNSPGPVRPGTFIDF